MNRQSNNFDELSTFKAAVKREKERELPSFEGVYAVFVDAETLIKFRVPVDLIASVRTIRSEEYPEGNVSKIRVAQSGGGYQVYYVRGDASAIHGVINEAKIRGGHRHEDV